MCSAQDIDDSGLVLADGPGYSVDINLQIQLRYTMSVAPDAPEPVDDPEYGFAFRRLRPKFTFETDDGSLKAVVQWEGRDRAGLRLLDAIIEHRLSDEWRFRFGQFTPSFDREAMVSSKRLLLVERSTSASTLNPNATDRVQALELRYAAGKDRVYFTFSEGFSQANTAYNDPTAEWGGTVRYERLLIGDSFSPMKQFTAPRDTPRGLMLGVAGHVQGLQNAGDRAAWTADLSFQDNGFNALLKATGHVAEDRNTRVSPEPESAYGVLGQMGVYATETIEPFIRYEWATTSDETHPDLSALAVGFNWYILGQALKLSTDFTVTLEGVGPAFDRGRDGLLLSPIGAERYVFRTQIQMLF